MRQRKIRWQKRSESRDLFVQQAMRRHRQITRLRICSDQQRQPIRRELRQDKVMPQRRAFRPRRQIPAFAFARIAESHRHQRHLCRIVKIFCRNPRPLPQTCPAWIVPRHAAGMHARTGRLPDDQNPRGSAELHHRPRTGGKMRHAMRAGCNIGAQRCNRYHRTQNGLSQATSASRNTRSFKGMNFRVG